MNNRYTKENLVRTDNYFACGDISPSEAHQINDELLQRQRELAGAIYYQKDLDRLL